MPCPFVDVHERIVRFPNLRERVATINFNRGDAFDDTPDHPIWVPDYDTLESWKSLQPGAKITIVKRSAKHHGEDRVSYPATVVASDLPTPWVETETHWTLGTVVQAHLTFETGDILREIFSPVHPFNAFAAYTANGDFKGWYANVTYPTLLDTSTEPPRLIWHDLFIDIVATPDGTVAVLDEDELTDSGLADTDPDLSAHILTARDHLLARFQRRQPPFHQSEVDRLT